MKCLKEYEKQLLEKEKSNFSRKWVESMTYEPTNKSAIEFAKENRLEEWVHIFLRGEGDNKAFSDGLKLMERKYTAPQLMSFDLFKRSYGTESDMKWRVPEEHVKYFWEKIKAISERYKTGAWDMPPIII